MYIILAARRLGIERETPGDALENGCAVLPRDLHAQFCDRLGGMN
jgi:hypothetical protein